MKRIAVFGGSFDPPHVAHVLSAAYVLSSYELDELRVIPTAVHPFGKTLRPYQHRLAMVQLAFRDLRGVRVSDLEARLGGTSKTLRTLQALQKDLPDTELRLVVGSDLLPSFPSWHQADLIEKLAPLLIVQRAGHVTDATQPALPAISSTDVRRRLQNGLSTAGLIPAAVARYIAEHKLYGEPNASADPGP